MESQWLLQCLRSMVVFVAFESAFGLQLRVPKTPVFLNQVVNLTWVLSPGDPASFNVNALCDNKTVPLQTAVQGSLEHLSIPMSKLPQDVRFPSGSCVFRATDTSNKSTLASSPSFVVLSANLPTSSIQPPPVSTTSTTTTSTTPTVSLSLTSTSFPSTSDTMTLSSSSGSLDSGTFQSSSTFSLTQALEQLTTNVEGSVSGQATAIMETFTTTDSLGNVRTITSQASLNIAGGLTSAPSGFTAVEKTTTITFVTGSSTSIATLTFTTDIPIQSVDSSNFSNASRLNPTQVASIVGGTLGAIIVLAFFVCLIRRRRPRPSILEPFIYNPGHRQPPEKSAENIPRPVQTEHTITSSSQLNPEVEDHVRPEDLEGLTQDALNARRLRLEVQRLSERIIELEIYGTQWPYPSTEDIRPPDYADTVDSYTYAQQITHA